MDLAPQFLGLLFAPLTLAVAAGACVYSGLSFRAPPPSEPTQESPQLMKLSFGLELERRLFRDPRIGDLHPSCLHDSAYIVSLEDHQHP